MGTDSGIDESKLQLKDGPYDGRSIEFRGNDQSSEGIALPVDDRKLPTDKPSTLYAVYSQRVPRSGVAHFSTYLHLASTEFKIQFVGGPLPISHPLPYPAMFGPPEIELVINGKGEVGNALDDDVRVAVYQKEGEGQAAHYRFVRFDEAQEKLSKLRDEEIENASRRAAKEFYRNPDYSIYSRQPTDEHKQVVIELGFRKATVDEGVAEVIKALWGLNLDTLGSCERLKSGKSYVAFFVQGDGQIAHDIISEAGIEVEFVPKTGSIRNNVGKKYSTKTAHIRFNFEDSARVVTALRIAKSKHP